MFSTVTAHGTIQIPRVAVNSVLQLESEQERWSHKANSAHTHTWDPLQCMLPIVQGSAAQRFITKQRSVQPLY